MILSLINLFMVSLIFLFSIVNSVYILFSFIILFIFTLSFMITVCEKNSWLSILFLIFLIGGLMVSFMYMVSLNHNNFKFVKFNSLLVLVIFYSMFLTNIGYLKMFFYLSFNCFNLKVNSIFYSWFFIEYFYMMLVIFVLLYLLLVMYFMDMKLKFYKNMIKEI